MNILVTGANGFIGGALVSALLKTSHNVIACVRDSVKPTLHCEYRFIDKLDSNTTWQEALEDIDVVVHCAGITSISRKESSKCLYEINTAATINLANQASKAGVKKFIFLSSIKVNGESTLLNKPFTPAISQPPTDTYAYSKYKAEVGLKDITNRSSMDYVIIRPTIVYGENVKGNFSSLMKWTYKGIPLPLGGIKNNLRSLVYIENLTDFVITCIDSPIAKNEVFLISDNDDISTANLLNYIAEGLGVKDRSLPVPPVLIKIAAKLIGKEDLAEKLYGSLQADISKSMKLLDWQPKYNTYSSILKTTSAYKSSSKKDNNTHCWQRPIDIIISSSGLIVTSPLLIGIILIGYFDTGSPLFIQQRMGKNKRPFKMLKFRTMKADTASVATHLVDSNSITKFGEILRKTKLDELPQLFNVLKGEMSLVGPRPNLLNQQQLIKARECQNVYNMLPGITGLAQINGIDMSTPELLAETDKKMIDSFSLKYYLSYIILTILGKGNGDAIK